MRCDRAITRLDFTLIEVIVAVAIFAAVIMVASLGLLSVQQTWKKTHRHADEMENLLKLDRVLDSSFRNIIPMYWTDEKSKKKRPVFVGEEDKVFFATMHRITKTNSSAIRYMTIYLDNGKLIAEYRRSPILAWDRKEEGAVKECLAENVREISFLYAVEGPTGKIDLEKEWLYDRIEPRKHPNMPLGIQLTITWNNDTRRQWFRRTAGSGRYENLGSMKRILK